MTMPKRRPKSQTRLVLHLQHLLDEAEFFYIETPDGIEVLCRQDIGTPVRRGELLYRRYSMKFCVTFVNAKTGEISLTDEFGVSQKTKPGDYDLEWRPLVLSLEGEK